MRRLLPWILGLTLLAAACGAPHKNAGEVKNVFTGDGGLEAKLSASCQALQQGALAAAVSRLNFPLSGCASNAGVYATELRSSGLYFHPEAGSTPASPNAESFRAVNRSQVWLNQSILDMAAIVLKKIRDHNASQAAIDGTTLSEYKFEDILTVKMNFVGEPSLDKEKLQVSQKFRISSSGLVETDLTAQLDFALIDSHLVAVVTSSSVGSNSFLKNVSATVLVIPHDGDIYVDSYVSLELFNVGYTEAVKRAVSSLLTAGINTVVQEIQELKGPAS